jgi:hypothetical protein
MNAISGLASISAIALLTAGCYAAPPRAQVVSRTVNAVEAGGPGEVWVLMGETGAQVDKDGAYINKDAYAVYHCVPSGCKRISELRGSQVFAR